MTVRETALHELEANLRYGMAGFIGGTKQDVPQVVSAAKCAIDATMREIDANLRRTLAEHVGSTRQDVARVVNATEELIVASLLANHGMSMEIPGHDGLPVRLVEYAPGVLPLPPEVAAWNVLARRGLESVKEDWAYAWCITLEQSTLKVYGPFAAMHTRHRLKTPGDYEYPTTRDQA